MNSSPKYRELFRRVERHFSRASDGCHDFDHTLRVMRNAELLLPSHPEADAEAVRLAALLHDIGRVDEPHASPSPGGHAEAGAKLAKMWLEELRLPPALVTKTVNAIARHRYRGELTPQTIEDKLLFDADKLDSLGAVGLARSFLFAGKLGARVHNRREEAVNSPPFSREDTAYREYLVKLRHLPERMFTDRARAVAAERMKFMEEFFHRLAEETSLE